MLYVDQLNFNSITLEVTTKNTRDMSRSKPLCLPQRGASRPSNPADFLDLNLLQTSAYPVHLTGHVAAYLKREHRSSQ